jgi:hypothetical protein
MACGFYLRLMRSKSIYEVLLEQGEFDETARQKAMNVIRNGYFTWYFLS